MKKLLGIIVIALVAAIVCAPFLLGRHAESQVEQVVGIFNEYPGYNVSIESYQRSWMNTTAEIRVGLDIGPMDPEVAANMPELDFTLMLAIDHGFVLLNDGVSLGLYEWRVGPTEQTLEAVHEGLSLTGDEPFYRLWGKTSLLGHTTFYDKARAFDLQSPEYNASFSGYAGEGSVTAGGELNYEGAMAEVAFTDGSTSGNASGLKLVMAGDLSRMDWDSMIYPAKFELSLDGMEFRSPFGAGGSMEDLYLDSEVILSDDGEAFDVKSDISLANVVTDAGSLTDFNLAMTFANLDKKAYEAYMDTYADILQTSQADMDAGKMPDFSQHFSPELIKQTVARGPEMRLDELKFSLPQGSFNASAAMTIDKDAEVPPPEMMMFWLMTAVGFTADLEIDRSLADYFATMAAAAQGQVPTEEGDPGVDMVEMMVAQGIFVEEDGKLESALKMEQGTMTVNGQPFPLGAMMQ